MSNGKPPRDKAPGRPPEETREALEFCFDDVSSLRMLGASPLSSLSAPAVAQAPAPAAAPVRRRNSGQRFSLLVLGLVILTAVATATALFFGRA